MGNRHEAPKLGLLNQVCDSTGAGFSQDHGTDTGNLHKAPKIGGQNQTITGNLQEAPKIGGQNQIHASTGAGFYQDHQTITGNFHDTPKIGGQNQISDSTIAVFSQDHQEIFTRHPKLEDRIKSVPTLVQAPLKIIRRSRETFTRHQQILLRCSLHSRI